MGKLTHIVTTRVDRIGYGQRFLSPLICRILDERFHPFPGAIPAICGQKFSIAFLAALVWHILLVQPAFAANPKDPTPATPPAPAATAKAPTPSRYVGNDLKFYVEALANQFAMHERAIDPFGQLQDPNAKPVAKPTVTKTHRRQTVEPPTTLTDIVGRIEITTIMPKVQRFLVGSRSIGQGDKLPLSYHNKQIHTQVTEVSSRRIVFRNLDTGEIGVRQLNILPLGMTPGTRNITAPGMVPANPNSPLEIDYQPILPAAAANP